MRELTYILPKWHAPSLSPPPPPPPTDNKYPSDNDVRFHDCATFFYPPPPATKQSYLLLPVYIMATRPNEIGNHFLASLVSRFLNEIKSIFLNNISIITAVSDYRQFEYMSKKKSLESALTLLETSLQSATGRTWMTMYLY